MQDDRHDVRRARSSSNSRNRVTTGEVKGLPLATNFIPSPI